MDPPVCPQDYSCTFTLTHPRVITHAVGPWWHGSWGVVVTTVAVIALALVLAFAVGSFFDWRTGIAKRRQAALDTERQRAHELALEEQRTLQADMAKGDPEMLKLIRQR